MKKYIKLLRIDKFVPTFFYFSQRAHGTDYSIKKNSVYNSSAFKFFGN